MENISEGTMIYILEGTDMIRYCEEIKVIKADYSFASNSVQENVIYLNC